MIGWNDWRKIELIKRKLAIIFPLYFIKVSCKILILISMQIYFFSFKDVVFHWQVEAYIFYFNQ